MKRKIKVTNKNLIEMLVGKIVILLVESVIACGLVLGFFWLLGLLVGWVEQSTLRTVVYFIVMGLIIARLIKKEIDLQ